MTIALKAWAMNGHVQSGYRGNEMTPEQARILARSLNEAADRAETHIQTLAQVVACVRRLNEDQEPERGILASSSEVAMPASAIGQD